MPNQPLDLNSRSVQDYLKALYKLQQGDAPVATNALAERLQLAPASVTAMVKKLAEAGLVDHVPYQGTRLTEQGRREALRMVRRHRIIEQFLQQVLGYAWDEVDEEAEVLEHAVSDRLVERMWQVLGQPSHDPHGSPIPTVEGELPEDRTHALTEAPMGTPLVVRRIQERSPDELRYLQSLGLAPGVTVTVTAQAPFDGPLTLQVAGSTVTLDARMAAAIRVEPAEG